MMNNDQIVTVAPIDPKLASARERKDATYISAAVLFVLARPGERVTTSAVAASLGVHAATIHNSMARMKGRSFEGYYLVAKPNNGGRSRWYLTVEKAEESP